MFNIFKKQKQNEVIRKTILKWFSYTFRNFDETQIVVDITCKQDFWVGDYYTIFIAYNNVEYRPLNCYSTGTHKSSFFASNKKQAISETEAKLLDIKYLLYNTKPKTIIKKDKKPENFGVYMNGRYQGQLDI